MTDHLGGGHSTDDQPIVCEGGPWDGWWYDAAGWARQQAAARRLDHTPDSIGGRVLAYQQTDRTEVNPLNRDRPAARRIPDGRVWRWTGG